MKTTISSDLIRRKLYFLGQLCSRASAGLGLSSSHRFSFPPWDTSISPCHRNPAKMLLKDILLPHKFCFYRIFLSHQFKGLVFSNLNNNDHLKIAPDIGYMKFISSIMVGPPKKKNKQKANKDGMIEKTGSRLDTELNKTCKCAVLSKVTSSYAGMNMFLN